MAAKQQPELELWQNAGRSRVSLRKFNSTGAIIRELVPGGRKVYVTPEERRLNQEVAASEELDCFANGMLVPVRLIDSNEDTAHLQANVNAMSEVAMKALFKSQAPAFKAKVSEISNTSTLERLLEVASDVDATMRQVQCVQERITALSPNVQEVTGTQIIGGNALGTRAPSNDNGRSVTGRVVSPSRTRLSTEI